MNNVMKGLFVSILIGMLLSIGGFAHASLTDGLVAYYPFNGNANDESGSGNNGTVNGTILTNDRFGNLNSAYNFNGANNYISINNFGTFTTFTVSTWVNRQSSTSIRESIISYKEGEGSSNYGFLLSLNEDGTNFRPRIYVKVNSSWLYAEDINSVPLNTWNHIVGIYDGSKIKIYINGVLKQETNAPGAMTQGTQKISIGSRASFDSNYFPGLIDDVRIYNRALSDDEIQQLNNENSQPVDTPTCYTQAEVDAKVVAAKEACRQDPASCGITATASSEDDYLFDIMLDLFAEPMDDTSTCSSFTSNILHIPCLNIEESYYFLDLRMTSFSNNTLCFDLIDIDTNPNY